MPKHKHPPVQIGDTFGKLVVVEKDSSIRPGRPNARWWVRCTCGDVVSVLQYNLRPNKRGHISGSCGKAGCRTATRHGHGRRGKERTPTYQAWDSMVQRCTNALSRTYPWYGGRGIGICARWRVFENFLQDMGERPGKSLSLDRIDTNGDYEPGNCRWATRRQQQGNLRSNVVLSFDGKAMHLADWARLTGIKRGTLQARYLRGFPVGDILFQGKWTKLRKRQHQDMLD